MTYISHKLDIAENHVEGLELQWTGGVKRGEASFAKYNEKEHSGRCILLQPLRREGVSEKRYTIGEMGEPAEEEKEKTEREYSKTYAKKIYII